MRVLAAVPDRPHGHNYLGDFLIAGFRELLGADSVVDVPQAPWLHLPTLAARDECVLDCDQTWLRHDVSFDAARDLVRDGAFDLIVGTDCPSIIGRLTEANVKGIPVAVVDGGDTAHDTSAEATAVARGHLGGYFKRELPLGATWGYPLPMTYPLDRMRPVTLDERDGRRTMVVYCTVSYGPAAPRDRIAQGLAARLASPHAFIVCDRVERDARLSPETLHGKMAGALIGVHWNPPFFPVRDHANQSGWDANRFWENCAMGLVTVGQRPFIQFPAGTEFTDGENVLWCDAPEEVASKVAELVADPRRARQMAVRAQVHFLLHHSAPARALYILKTCGVRA